MPLRIRTLELASTVDPSPILSYGFRGVSEGRYQRCKVHSWIQAQISPIPIWWDYRLL